jgi:hypothetical protein
MRPLIRRSNRFVGARVALLMVVLSLSSAHSAFGQDKTRTKAGANRSATIAEVGFYLELSRCHACGPAHPQNAMIAFRGRGISAFYGMPKYDAQGNIEFLEKLQGVYGFPVSLFAGPFQTEAAAQRVVSEVPSILRRQIAEDRSSTGGSPQGSTGFFDVKVVRVRSARVTGNIPDLSTADLVIQPGIGVGRVLIGNSKGDVYAVLGKPRDAAADAESWRSGVESLTVSYRNGVVDQINVTSPKFHTATGLTVAASSQVFLQAFPASAKLCCGWYGASGSTEWTCWDAVARGIALQKGSSGGYPYNALIVHPVNRAVKQSDSGDEGCKPCVP